MYNKRHLPLILFIFFISLVSVGFTQQGTYEQCNIPKEHLRSLRDSMGNNIIPPLTIGTVTIKLKSRKRAIVIYNINTRNEKVLKGLWSENRNTITVDVKSESEKRKLEYILLKLESGVYLKTREGYSYFKRR